jgi:Flp pilus assembly protein TadD
MTFEFTLRWLAPAFVALAIAASPAIAVDTGTPVPELASARADIEAEHWADAIEKLKIIVDANNNDADAYNLLGYALRHTGATDRAMQAYKRALTINPQHTGALEYQGVLFVMLGDLDKANANLARLETICGTSCEEYEELEEAIKG